MYNDKRKEWYNTEDIITIGNNELQVKEWDGKRVVTFADIDRVHERPEGAARKRFHDNRERFIEGEDFYKICASVFRTHKLGEISPKTHEDVVLISESGYLMLVKSFRDDLAWDVQRKLVNSYFKFNEVIESVQETNNALVLPPEQFNEAVATLTNCASMFQNCASIFQNFESTVQSVMSYSTINYKQQQELAKCARKRMNELLGNTHSDLYKAKSRIYFKNMWQDFCEKFSCGSYRDLNPADMDAAKEYLSKWAYAE